MTSHCRNSDRKYQQSFKNIVISIFFFFFLVELTKGKKAKVRIQKREEKISWMKGQTNDIVNGDGCKRTIEEMN